MYRPIDLKTVPFFAKLIDLRFGYDSWNSFLASVATGAEHLNDPLAHLHAGASAHSTTLIHISENIRPKLWERQTGGANFSSGVLFSADKSLKFFTCQKIIPSAILVHVAVNPAEFYSAILLSLKRMFDLKFALFRKFGDLRQNIPFVIYNPSFGVQTVLNGFFVLEDCENLTEFILNLLKTVFPTASETIVTEDATYEKTSLFFQHGLYQFLTNQALSNPNFFAFLEMPPQRPSHYTTPLFYVETLRALVACVTNPKKPFNIFRWHETYRNLLSPFLSGTHDENEMKFFQYRLNADFGALTLQERVEKVNIRFLPHDHPLRMESLSYKFLRAVKERNTLEVRELLSVPGLNFNIEDAKQNDALFFAIDNGMIEMVRLLLTQSSINVNHVNHVNQYRFTALIAACALYKADIAVLLIQTPNIDVNALDANGESALTWAIEHNMIEIVRVLLTKPGIQVNQKNSIGHVPLLSACMQNKSEISAMLLQMPDIRVNMVNIFNTTPLMWAVKNEMHEIVRLMLTKKDIHVNHTDINGQTALMYAKSSVCRKLIIDYKNSHYIAFLPQELQYLKTFYSDAKSSENTCSLCHDQRPFTLFHQKHHCKSCGNSVCSKHSAMIPMSWKAGQAVRYCQKCVPV